MDPSSCSDPSSLRRQWDEYETAKSLLSGLFLLRCAVPLHPQYNRAVWAIRYAHC